MMETFIGDHRNYDELRASQAARRDEVNERRDPPGTPRLTMPYRRRLADLPHHRERGPCRCRRCHGRCRRSASARITAPPCC